MSCYEVILATASIGGFSWGGTSEHEERAMHRNDLVLRASLPPIPWCETLGTRLAATLREGEK